MGNPKSHKWFIIFAILALIIAVFLIWNENKRHMELQAGSVGGLMQRINDFNLTRFKGGEIEWVVVARSATVAEREEEAVIEDIHISYLPHKGTPIKLSAEQGRYNLGKNNLLVEKGKKEVDVKIGQGIMIKGSELMWAGDRREMRIPGQVSVIGEKFILKGENLVANVDSGTYEMRGNIRAMLW